MNSEITIKVSSHSITCHVNKAEKKNNFANAVVFCVDKSYIPYSLFCAQQLLEKEKNRSFEICICVSDINLVPEHFKRMDVRFIELNPIGTESLPVDHLSLAAYNRVFLPRIFAEEYQRIIYLDADVYINRPFFSDLMSICDTFDKDFCVAAAPDITEVVQKLKTKNKVPSEISNYLSVYHKSQHLYRNSGILVFNVQSCLECKFVERVFEAAFNKHSDLRYHDQSALNIAFKGEMPVIPFEFNWQLLEINYRLVDKINPYILHFIGRNKPWVFDCEYTKTYMLEYREFLSKYFPSMLQPLRTHSQVRHMNPKYDNIRREKRSIFISELKEPFSTFIRNTKFSLYRNNQVENAIRLVNENKLS